MIEKDDIMRTAKIHRTTKETDISCEIVLDSSSKTDISTGIGFLDHMLTAFSVHSGISVTLKAKGDLNVDGHHTAEDVGIVLGQCFAKALSDKGGIARYGSAYIPMDEALAFACVDISNRPYLVFDCDFKNERIGDFETCLALEFFRAFAFNALIALHIKAIYGENDHHKCEAIFKACAHAIKEAVAVKGAKAVTLSTKGVI